MTNREDDSRLSQLDQLRLDGAGDAQAPDIQQTAVDRQRILSRRLKQAGIGLGALLVVALLIWGGVSFWQNRPLPPPGTVTGLVVNLQETPIANAIVSVDGLSDIQTTTGEDGRYTLDNIPPGSQRILIELPNGASGAAITVVVGSAQQSDLGVSRLFQP